MPVSSVTALYRVRILGDREAPSCQVEQTDGGTCRSEVLDLILDLVLDFDLTP